MSSRMPGWSDRHARRYEVLAIALAIGFVIAMAVTVVLVSHTWTAGSISSAAR